MINKKLQQLTLLTTTVAIMLSCGDSTDSNTADVNSAFTINAKIDSIDFKIAYLCNVIDGELVKVDSMAIQDGQFSFSGTTQLPEVHYIAFDNARASIPVFVEGADIAITGNGGSNRSVEVKGSVTHDQLVQFNEQAGVYDQKLKAIVDEYYALAKDGDKALLAALDIKYDQEDSLKKAFIKDYISSNLNSVIAPYLVLKFMANNSDAEELEALNNGFDDQIRSSKYAQQIEKRITLIKNTAIGQPAPLFEMNDTEGNSVALANFKGNYVLIDFWASWCGPCRRENPNVVAAYQKYHDKGFEILGVSFDANKEKWLAAIEKDQLTWTQVSDLKGWGNAAGKIYGIKAIPHSVLVDREGIIVAKNLREQELHEKLEEIFGAES